MSFESESGKIVAIAEVALTGTNDFFELVVHPFSKTTQLDLNFDFFFFNFRTKKLLI